MSNITTFNFDALQVRAALRDGEPWFVASDVCAVLDIADVRQAVERLDDSERGGCTVPTPGGPQEVRVVNESGMYALIFTSRKPEAQRFRRWVTGEVLPSIRRTGGYAMQSPKTSSAEDMETMRVLADALRLEGSARLDVMSRAMAIVAPHLLPAVPVYAIDAPPSTTGEAPTSSMPTASLTTLLDEFDIGVSAVTANKMLANAGMLEAIERPSSKGVSKRFWSVTDAGLKYGKNVVSPSNPKETQPHWYKATFKELAYYHMTMAAIAA